MVKKLVKSFSLIVWVALWYLPVYLAKRLQKQELYNHMIQFCSLGMLFITGIRLKVSGQPSEVRPLLLVSNHISYLDILLLSSQLPVRFTPKSEIAGWPVIGNISRLCDAVFIDRRIEMVKEMKQRLHDALRQGKVISLFPEATTGDGIHLQPFKSGFFSLAEEDWGEHKLTIQPVAITYTHIRKLPIDRSQWPDIAWYGDMDLIPHLSSVLSLAPLDAELVFLEPIVVEKSMDRKQLAAQCHRQIQAAIEEIRSRRPAITKHGATLQTPPVLKIKDN